MSNVIEALKLAIEKGHGTPDWMVNTKVGATCRNPKADSADKFLAYLAGIDNNLQSRVPVRVDMVNPTYLKKLLENQVWEIISPAVTSLVYKLPELGPKTHIDLLTLNYFTLFIPHPSGMSKANKGFVYAVINQGFVLNNNGK